MAKKKKTAGKGAAEQTAPAGEEQVTATEVLEEDTAATAEEQAEGSEEVLEPTVEPAAEDGPSADEDDAPEAGAESAEGQDEGSEEDEEAASGEQEASETINPFEAIKAEVTELRDRHARLQAEWDNYRKRTAAERKSERDRAAEKLVTDLLPVLDDLERAINHARESGEGGTLTDGVEAIQGKFLQILGKHKVSVVPAKGEAFDAMKHQAVGTQEDESVPEETVVQVYQQGYQMGDRVIRPAMVVTSTGGPARVAEEEAE